MRRCLSPLKLTVAPRLKYNFDRMKLQYIIIVVVVILINGYENCKFRQIPTTVKE